MGRIAGFILDTSILIASERRGEGVEDILLRMLAQYEAADVAISVVSAVELTHGLFRTKTGIVKDRRENFVQGALSNVVAHPVSLEIAQLAGRIEGEQAAVGNVIALADLLIGATALHLGYAVATLNTRHFERIPGLQVVTV